MSIVSAGKYNSTPPTMTDGQMGPMQLDANGRLQTTDGFSTSVITYTPALSLVWTAVTPTNPSSKLTIKNNWAARELECQINSLHIKTLGNSSFT